MLGVHQNILDFELLETGNPKTLVFLDASQYIAEPDRPLLEITLPGYTKYFLANVAARTVNVFNSSTIGFNRVLSTDSLIDLPDGVWEFKYKICPYKYVYVIKKQMRVTTLLNKLHELYRQIDLSSCDTVKDKQIQSLLTRVHTLIEGSKAEAETDSKKAQEYYQIADRLIQTQLNRLCKNC